MFTLQDIQLHKSESYRLGCYAQDCFAHFAFASEADSIRLLLCSEDLSGDPLTIELDSGYKVGNVFSVDITGVDLAGYLYLYEVNQCFIVDPYATAIRGCTAIGKCPGTRYAVIGTKAFDWDQDEYPRIPSQDLIIYKLHVRNYTKGRNSGVRKKGTFAGLTDKIPYLQDLGINAVELMPIYEFQDYKEGNPVNCWGYTEGFYMAPKAAYSATYSNNGDYTAELKKMIADFHKAGIEVILEFYFAPSTSTVLVVDTIRYWKRFYHIDGVHIICADEVRNVLAQDPYLKDTKLFCSIWPQDTNHPSIYEYHEGFSQVARKLLKGDEDQMQQFLEAFRRNPFHAGNVNYITTHNGFTLMDLVSYDRKHNEANGENNRDGVDYNLSWNHGVEGPSKARKVLWLRNKSRKNAMAMLLLAQGIPMIYGGDEFGNSQNGNNNPYCLDDETSWVNWSNLKKDEDFFNFVKTLIAFRKENPVLHMSNETYMTDYKYHGLPDISYHGTKAWYPEIMHYTRHIGVLLCGKYADQESNIYIAFNLHWEAHALALPKVSGRKWEYVMDTMGTSFIDLEGRKELMVEPRSIVILKDTKNS